MAITTRDIDPAYILYGVLIFSWVEFVWEAYLSIRQRRIYRKNTTTPPELQGIFSQILSTILIWFFAFKYVWDLSGHVNREILGIGDSEIYQSMMFLFIFNLFSTVIN